MHNLIKKYFDYEYYRQKYPDIIQHCKTYEDCIWHFCGKNLDGDGMKEGRLFNRKLEELEKYTTEKYVIDNPSLKNKKKIDVDLHFLDNYEINKLKFKNEIDNITKYFDIEFYRKNNSDLKNLNELELKTHFINHGKKEGRLFNEKLKEFDKKTYLEENKETDKYLVNKSIYKLYIHFLDNYKEFIYIKNGLIKNINLKDISNLENTVVIIHNYNMHKGGSLKFLKDIYSNFKEYDYLFVWSKNVLDKINFSKNKIMILQYFLFTNIAVNILKNIIIHYNIKLIIPLHDFYFCNNDKDMYKLYNLEYNLEYNVHNSYLNSNIKINSTLSCLFYIAYKILCPSDFLYSIYSKIYKNSNLIRFNWIDYELDKNIKYRRQKIVNNFINIGMLSENSIYKGKEYVNKLEKVIKYKNYKINILIIDKNLPKYNEEEYFTFIKKYNINGLLYLNKWGETHCYSLTKALLTGIPIFYNNIGCFKERIPIAEHYIKNVESEEYVIDEKILIKNYYRFLDVIIENGYDTYDTINSHKIINKQNYQGNFKDLLEYNSDYKLESNNNLTNCIIITSKIIVSNNKLTYIDTRSIYTKEERLQQTINTIYSIKKNFSNYYIILVDNSNFDEYCYNKLNNLVDIFINIVDNNEYNYFTDIDKQKGSGDLYQLNIALKYIIDNNLKFNNIFKLSGRYIINSTFNISDYNNDYNIFKKNLNVTDREYIYTSFFKIYFSNINEIYDLNKYLIKNITGKKIDIETMLYKNIKSNKKLILNLGITQNIAVWKDTSNI